MSYENSKTLKDIERATVGHKFDIIVRKHYNLMDRNIDSVIAKNELKRLKNRRKIRCDFREDEIP
ncbi:hypothetical protein [Thermococcus sp. GR6]|uniref:hypothetical protein n=1 Tax=Thermococcus sp. GR6 TaxID=1638256 RepID=UPI00143185E5|nr:hypothetical protein [Thermococcus sp. GR6]NJE41836.1 hypothetical protein [Thermococcus sp. GR6]